MSLTRKAPSAKDQGDFELCPAGTFPAVCVAVVTTGTHNESFKGEEPKDAEKVYLAWELIGETMAASKYSHVIAREYTFSLNSKANLRKLIDAWRGKPLADGEEFDLTKLAGQPCLLTVAHTTPNAEGKSYANVAGVTKPMKGQVVGKPMRPVIVYDEIAEPDSEDALALSWSWLPRIYGELVFDRIKGSKEWKALGGSPPAKPTNGNGAAPQTAAEASDPAPF